MSGYKFGIGPVQSELIRLAHTSGYKRVLVADYRNRRAMRSLVTRKIFEPDYSYPDVYRLTTEWRK